MTLPEALERIADLEEEVAYLKGELGMTVDDLALIRLMSRGLTAQEARLLLALARVHPRPLSACYLREYLPASKGRKDDPDSPPNNYASVLVCNIRRKLGPVVANVYGVGYRLTEHGLRALA